MIGRKIAVAFSLIMLAAIILIALTMSCLATPAETGEAPGETTMPTGMEKSFYAISACVAASVALGVAGYGLAQTCVAAISAITEKPELFSLTFAYVIFLEAIGVYGLIIMFLMLPKL